MTNSLTAALRRHRPLAPQSHQPVVIEDPFPVSTPYLVESVELDDLNPAIRLDPLRSGIGIATVAGKTPGQGIEAYAWEDHAGQGGLALPSGKGSVGPVQAIGYHHKIGANTVVLSLTRFNMLRRLVLASQSTDLVLTLQPSNVKIAMRSVNGDFVLYLYRVGNEIEIRRERISTHDLLSAFGIENTTFPQLA